jgi:hypothetical protein
MIGVFCKDIWGIIYEKLETSYDPRALNKLSITCKKLHSIDMERRKKYIFQYEKQGPLIQKLKKGRQNYLNLVKYAPISCYIYPYKYFEITFESANNWLNSYFLGTKNEEELISRLGNILNVKQLAQYYEDKDLELIQAQVKASDLQYMFSYIKNNGDIVDTIMDIQF